jgi:spermidine synthase
VLASTHEYELPTTLPDGMKFLTLEVLPELFRFPNDMRPMVIEPNRLNDQILVRLYEREWRDIVH